MHSRICSLSLAILAVAFVTGAQGITFAPTGSLIAARAGATATLLQNGKILIVGGGTPFALFSSAELYDPITGSFAPTGSMTTPRVFHTATLLPNGEVLVTGGHDGGGATLSSAELYDPLTGTFRRTGSMSQTRQRQTASLLSNGKVLIAGGMVNSTRGITSLASAELYDPSTETFTPTGNMGSPRFSQTATLLHNGQVLIAGGSGPVPIPNTVAAPLSTAELYTAATGTFTPTASMTTARAGQTATLLDNGQVLVVGGENGAVLATADLYDPVTGMFDPTGSLNTARAGHTATLLDNGEVLIAGGLGINEASVLSSTELYDPADGRFTPAGSMLTPRWDDTATLLRDGQVLIASGFADATGTSLPTATAELGTNSSCQITPANKFLQFVNPPANEYQPVMEYPSLSTSAVPQYFGHLPSPNLNGYVLCPMIGSGCALASIATMLTSFPGLTNVTPTSLDCELRGDCGSPNGYGTGKINLCPESLSTCTASDATERYPDWCEMSWCGVEDLYPQIIRWVNGSQISSNMLFDSYAQSYVSVNQYLTDTVCTNGDRVILQLQESVNGVPVGTHYIFVTGKSADGSDWSVFDPGWSVAATAAPTLGDHESGFCTRKSSTGSCTFRQFTVEGARAYGNVPSTGNAGAFCATANSPVELLVTDNEGRRLGRAAGDDVFEIPGGSYIRDFPFADDSGQETANGDPTGLKTAHVPSPMSGTYAVTATGTALGTYTLTIGSLAPDGTVESTTLQGVTNTGLSTTYQFSISATTGKAGSVRLLATFQSTLADIADCLALKMIDSTGIANALSSKIMAAANASATGNVTTALNILGALIKQINAQTGKHITGLAPQVLSADAQSLIAQLSR